MRKIYCRAQEQGPRASLIARPDPSQFFDKRVRCVGHFVGTSAFSSSLQFRTTEM
jgi:hypothetical protein